MYFSQILTPEQQHAINLMNSGCNVFLTGEAGCGKSTVLNAFLGQTTKSVLVAAPTNTAAQAIGGKTVHSAFSIPVEFFVEREKVQLSEFNSKIIAAAEVIVIDEISMVRADIFQTVWQILNEFGNKQLIVVGDFFQLPPVITENFLRLTVAASFGGAYAFQTPAWREACFNNVYLRQVHRQQDQHYLNILNSIRYNGNTSYSLKQAIAEINEACYRPNEVRDEAAVILCARKEDEQYYNMTACQNIHNPKIYSKGEIDNFPYKAMPTPTRLPVHKGVRVMMVKNKSGFTELNNFANGEMGVITGFETYETQNFFVNILLDSGRIIVVWKEYFDNYHFNLNVDSQGRINIVKEEIGYYKQLPFRLAYAITVHRSQGKTLSKAHIDLGEDGSFSPNQLYVALSRVSYLKGLTLARPLKVSDVISDPAVVSFYNQLRTS